MVDFNNETTVSTPAIDVVRILILQRRNDVLEAIEHYYKVDDSGAESDSGIVKSRIISLYLEIEGMIKKRTKDDDYKETHKAIIKIKQSGIADLIKIFSDFNMMLYDINLTKIDNKPEYDTTKVEGENALHSL